MPGIRLNRNPAIRRCGRITRVITLIAAMTIPAGAVTIEHEFGVLAQDLADDRPLLATVYEVGAVWPWWGGTANVEVEGGQRSDGDEQGYTQDFVVNLNQMIEESPVKVGKVVWRRTWSPQWFTAIGRFAPESYIDKLALASSKTTRFLSRPLVRPTAVADPGTSVGLLVRRELFQGARVTYLINDANGTGRLSPFHTLKGEWFHLMEITLPRGRHGKLRLLPWTTERQGRDAHGLSVSYEDRISDGLGWFLRTGTERGDLARTPRLFAVGLGWDATSRDHLGVALVEARGPRGLRGETLVETYFRHAFTEELAVSIHFQQSERRQRTTGSRDAENVVTFRLLWAGDWKLR